MKPNELLIKQDFYYSFAFYTHHIFYVRKRIKMKPNELLIKQDFYYSFAFYTHHIFYVRKRIKMIPNELDMKHLTAKALHKKHKTLPLTIRVVRQKDNVNETLLIIIHN